MIRLALIAVCLLMFVIGEVVGFYRGYRAGMKHSGEMTVTCQGPTLAPTCKCNCVLCKCDHGTCAGECSCKCPDCECGPGKCEGEEDPNWEPSVG